MQVLAFPGLKDREDVVVEVEVEGVEVSEAVTEVGLQAATEVASEEVEEGESFILWMVRHVHRRLFRVFTAGGSPANVDARLANKSEDQLIASLSSLTLTDKDIPLRPEFGTEG